MADAIRVTGPINAGGLEMTLETGKLAPQADGAVLVPLVDRERDHEDEPEDPDRPPVPPGVDNR